MTGQGAVFIFALGLLIVPVVVEGWLTEHNERKCLECGRWYILHWWHTLLTGHYNWKRKR